MKRRDFLALSIIGGAAAAIPAAALASGKPEHEFLRYAADVEIRYMPSMAVTEVTFIRPGRHVTVQITDEQVVQMGITDADELVMFADDIIHKRNWLI